MGSLSNLYSIFYTLRVSFTSWDGINDPVWIGMSNYVQLLKDQLFLKSVGNTILVTVVAGGMQLVTALVLAYVLNQRFIRFPNAFKCIYYFITFQLK